MEHCGTPKVFFSSLFLNLVYPFARKSEKNQWHSHCNLGNLWSVFFSVFFLSLYKWYFSSFVCLYSVLRVVSYLFILRDLGVILVSAVALMVFFHGAGGLKTNFPYMERRDFIYFFYTSVRILTCLSTTYADKIP